MRRLPVFLVIDVSESMVGTGLSQLAEALGAMASALRRDPYVLETAHVSVIVFAGRVRTLSPLVDVASWRPPELVVGGGTSLGAALMHLMNEIDRQVIRATPEQRGDWRPLVFLVTDGRPTDDLTAATQRWNRLYRGGSQLVAVSIGGCADHAALLRLTDDVVIFDDSLPGAYGKFANWISASIQGQCRSVSSGVDQRVSLAKAEMDAVAAATIDDDGGQSPADERYVVLVGRCEKTRLPYLIKFHKHGGRVNTTNPDVIELARTKPYILETAVAVGEGYSELTDSNESPDRISTDLLIGQPPCPHCNVPFSMAECGDCGGILCVAGAGRHECPWCGSVCQYELTAEDFDGDRGSG